MDYTTYYIQGTATALFTTSAPALIRTVNANSLYSNVDGDKQVFLKEVSLMSFNWDASGSFARILFSTIGIAEAGNSLRASRNLPMTIVGNDLNVPNSDILYASMYQKWQGKVKLPPIFNINVYYGDAVAFGVGDLYHFYIGLAYDLENQ